MRGIFFDLCGRVETQYFASHYKSKQRREVSRLYVIEK
jgi:hypothetical protein